MSTIYSPERMVNDTSACRFYHTFDYPDGERVQGDWDLRGMADSYLGGVRLAGKRVMDMGAASGFMSFEMERMGADIVSVDVASVSQYTKVPYIDEPNSYHPKKVAETCAGGLDRMKNSYWYSWRKYRSKAKVFYGDLFELPEELGLFDASFIAQILVHNRDPLGLLISVARCTKETLIISEGMEKSDKALAYLLPDVAAGIRPHGWFRFTTKAMEHVLEIVGFEVDSVSCASYRCNIRNEMTPITTVVARRRVPIPR